MLGPRPGSVVVVAVVGGGAVDLLWGDSGTHREPLLCRLRCSGGPRWRRPMREGRPTRRGRPTSAAESVASAARPPHRSRKCPLPRRDLRCRVDREEFRSHAQSRRRPRSRRIERSAVPSGEESQLGDGETEDVMGVSTSTSSALIPSWRRSMRVRARTSRSVSVFRAIGSATADVIGTCCCCRSRALKSRRRIRHRMAERRSSTA